MRSFFLVRVSRASYGDAMITRMQHVHYLNCQHNHHAPACFARRTGYAQFQILAAVDHVCEHMIDGVLVYAGSFSNDLAHFATYAAQKSLQRWVWPVWRGSSEKIRLQISIINGRPIKIVLLTFASIVFAQSDPNAESGSTFVRMRLRGLVPASSLISSSMYSSLRNAGQPL